jgi:hypothetical protein
VTDHYVALLSWDVREHWPEVAPKDAKGQPAHPYAYGSCHDYFPALAKTKPVLWVVASPDYGPGSKRLPPTLIARLQIRGVCHGTHPLDQHCSGQRLIRPEDYKWVARADPRDPDSRYFRINNAFHELTTIRFVAADGTVRKIPRAPRHAANPYSHIPTYLENIRRVFPGDERWLEDLARRVDQRRTVFLSYSHADNAAFARELADALRELDFAPWIDFATIPELRAGMGKYSRPLLAQMMADGIRQAGLVVVMRSRHYGRTEWTRYEWDIIHQPPWQGALLPVVQIVSSPKPGQRSQDVVARRSPALTAQRVAHWWDTRGRRLRR